MSKQGNNPMTNRWKQAVWVSAVSLALLSGLTPSAQAGKKKEDKDKKPAPAQTGPVDRSKIDTSKLVWPAPPDVARIRWMQELFGEIPPPKEAAPKKKKQGWMDRLAGVQEQTAAGPAQRTHFLAKPYGVATDSKGRIYVADSFVAAVFIFDLESKKVSLIRNTIDARFKTIIGLAMDDTDRLFVADSALHHIVVFDANGKFETSFGDDQLQRPSGVAIDTENRFIYVVDTGKERVAVFDADSFKLLRTIGGPSKTEGGDETGSFAKPTNVAVDSDGNVYVTDTLNNRIQIFDADGNFISTFGKAGDGPGYFARPKGVAIDPDGHVWVADAMQNRVQLFDKEGHLLAYFGEGGSYPGQFGLPSGLAFDKFNRVIVADQLDGRIQVFRYVTDAEAAAQKSERDKNADVKKAGSEGIAKN